jgi:membrane associated rhomboid family serine protease
MFPLKTLPNTKKKPHLTRFLVFLNVLVFLGQWFFEIFRGVDLASIWGVVPHCYIAPTGCGVVSLEGAKTLWIAPLVALFLHADVLHLAFNMLFLSCFGGGLEDKVGRIRYALIYFGGGFAASAAHVVFHLFSNNPTIGASGAIAAVLGAYLVVWILGQVTGALGDFHPGQASEGGGIAWMAHLGGFLAGAFYGWRIAPWVKKKKASRV